MKARTSLFLSAALIAIFLQFGCGASSSDGQTRTILLPGHIPLEVVQTPRGLWFGKYEVTQAQWVAVMGENPSWFKNLDNPVEKVSWYDCQEFLTKLNALPAVKKSGLTFRLPTDEEWEYACRAGSTGDYCRLADGMEITEDTLGQVAWFDDNSADKTHPVGQKKPNAFGLYDMHGNVWEWCQEEYGTIVSWAKGRDYEHDRVNRGGSWYISAWACGSSVRDRFSPSSRYPSLGFRLCASGRTATAARSEKGFNGILGLGSGVSLEMVHCPGVASDFWMGKFEVTQEQWERVMGKNPSEFKGAKKPVETVSWNDCQEFVAKLNALPAAKARGLAFRLPTEEEWETACRAGAPKSERYCKLADGTQITESNLSRVAWFDKSWDDGPTEVGKNREPNAWGLYDMHGNVWEWTQTADGDSRVFRGGCFGSAADDDCTAGYWFCGRPDDRYGYLGFRLCASGRTAAAPAKPETAARTSDGKQAARSAAASRSEKGFNGILGLGSGVSLEMVHCPGVASDFWMGKFEVTQEQWELVMGTTPSYFKNKPKNPVETVSWNDCQEFIRKLNDLSAAKASGLMFRLPTEEEWETACRAGAPKSERYCKLADGTQITESNLSRVAWFGKDWDDGPTEVGKNREPNAWGLYDMHGNVWEWTQTAVGGDRVGRGGSFDLSADDCTAGSWDGFTPDFRYGSLGFRLAASGRTAAK